MVSDVTYRRTAAAFTLAGYLLLKFDTITISRLSKSKVRGDNYPDDWGDRLTPVIEGLTQQVTSLEKKLLAAHEAQAQLANDTGNNW